MSKDRFLGREVLKRENPKHQLTYIFEIQIGQKKSGFKPDFFLKLFTCHIFNKINNTI